MDILEKIKNYLANYKKRNKRICQSSFKPFGLLGMVITVCVILLILFSGLQIEILTPISILLLIVIIILINFEILNRVLNKKGDELDKEITSNIIFMAVLFFIIFIVYLILLGLKII